MAKGKNHITDSKDYQRYLDNQMTQQERHDYEKLMLEDEFENEALDGLSQLSSPELEADLDYLKDRLNSGTNGKKIFAYWRMAAAFVLLGIFSFLAYYLLESNKTSEVAQQKNAPPIDMPVIQEKNDTSLQIQADADSNPVIARQQEFPAKAGSGTKTDLKEISTSPPDPIELREEVLAESINDELEPGAINLDLEEDELYSIAEVPNAEMAIEERHSRQTKEIESQEKFAPQAVLSKAATSSQARFSASEEMTRTVTGIILSEEDDEAIPGVNITVKGRGIGTISDIDGKYSINLPDDTVVTLVFSYIGLISEERMVNDLEAIDVIMESSNSTLNEVVVVARGLERNNKKSEYSYSPPEPVGGNAEFKNYIKGNIRYPTSGLEEKINGTVRIKFTVEQDGKISNMEIEKSMGEDFDNEAIRLLTEGPAWEPANENNASVVKDVTVKIRFRLPGN